MTSYSRTLILLFALIYLLLGVLCISYPFAISSLVGLMPIGRSGLTEFIVFFGGGMLAIGIFFALALRKKELSLAAMYFAFISSIVLAITRTISLIYVIGLQSMTDTIKPITWVEFFSEILLAVFATIAFIKELRARS